VLKEIARVGAAPADSDELDARKASLVGDFSRNLETTGGLAAQIAGLEMDGVALAELAQVIPRVSEVTPEAVREFARVHWRAEDLRVIVAGDAKQFGAGAVQPIAGALVIEQKRVDLDQPALVKAAPR